jgi:hypothetical protein
MTLRPRYDRPACTCDREAGRPWFVGLTLAVGNPLSPTRGREEIARRRPWGEIVDPLHGAQIRHAANQAASRDAEARLSQRWTGDVAVPIGFFWLRSSRCSKPRIRFRATAFPWHLRLAFASAVALRE